MIRLLLFLTILPLVELALLIRISQATSVWFTIALIVVTGYFGFRLMRHQGLRVLRQFQAQMGRGQMPAAALVDHLTILLAGALLVAPGVLTDIAGVLLLIPFCRRAFRRELSRQFALRLNAKSFVAGSTGAAAQPSTGQFDVIDVESFPVQKRSAKQVKVRRSR
jgi:UPF0716 protein FxsA